MACKLPGLHHLVLFGQVDPQLEPPQVSLGHLGHFAVHNAPPSSHPLHTPRANHPLHRHEGQKAQKEHLGRCEEWMSIGGCC